MAQRKRKEAGRPTDFRPKYCEQVERLCRLGATDEDIAAFFGKATSTINLWKAKHPKFLESIKKGKVVADIEVANSLYKRATGHVMKVEKVVNGAKVRLNIEVEPDTAAAIFWLKNRRKDHWRDKHEVDVRDKTHEDMLAELESAIGQTEHERVH